MFAGIRVFFWACCFVMRGLDPRIHLVRKKLFAKADGLPGHKRVTRVFNALCPTMTACKGRRLRAVCPPYSANDRKRAPPSPPPSQRPAPAPAEDDEDHVVRHKECRHPECRDPIGRAHAWRGAVNGSERNRKHEIKPATDGQERDQ